MDPLPPPLKSKRVRKYLKRKGAHGRNACTPGTRRGWKRGRPPYPPGICKSIKGKGLREGAFVRM